MQRRVSLVFSEQSMPVKKQSSSSNLQSLSIQQQEPSSVPIEHAESVFATNKPSCPMLKKDFHSSHINDLRQKLLSTPRRLKNSFDDIDLLHEPERRGSIPMIGSLIYYKRKNEECDSNYTTNPPNKNEHDSNSQNMALTKPLNQELKVFRHFSTPEVIKDHIPLRPRFNFLHHTNISEKTPKCAINDESDASPIYQSDIDDDEFSLINSKIHSQIKKNTQKFNKFIREQKEKTKFGRHHFHIPGIDPEVNDDSHESLNPIASNESSGTTSFSKKSNSSPHLTGNSDYQPTKVESDQFANDALQPTRSPNSRHRRRLTCAMIFTPPKVVEI
ncbi:hypothetical protein CANINC_002287 [Pichia inconspicua]|uniref:Uncharacterized protein n=1 Tax=Pichia inconspicua TaxID=52247 RepID=A0A4T0X1F2_9ASCO|nr:hypothetical protein CANINC_002287 [[Candida] inconspicua]